MAFVNSASTVGSGGDKIPVRLMGGKVRSAVAEFTYASDATGSYTAPELYFKAGAVILDVALNTSVTAGASATLALGISGTTGKYRAAATLTSTDQWVNVGLNAAMGVALTAAEQWLLTVAVAALPSSGRLLIRVLYSDNS